MKNTPAKVMLYYSSESRIMLGMSERSKSSEEKVWKDLSRFEWRDFLGEDSVDTLIEEFGNFHTETKKGISVIADLDSDFYNCKDGKRITVGVPSQPDRRIIFYGPCTIAGAYCRDNHTIESFLQKRINENNKINIEVVNKGHFSPYNNFSTIMTDELSSNDIVIFYIFKKWITDFVMDNCEFIGDLTDTFLSVPELQNNILDIPDHCNFLVNEMLANRIYSDLKNTKLLDCSFDNSSKVKIQDYYIGNETLSEIFLYINNNEITINDDIKVGAFVQTFDLPIQIYIEKIEHASRMVDKLYLFVQEDSNLNNSLEDRINRLTEMTNELENVYVIPAGRYLYSKKISRAIRKGKLCDEEMEYDCEIFGEIFAENVGIRHRFIMEEFCNYIEQRYITYCAKILPDFGVEVTIL